MKDEKLLLILETIPQAATLTAVAHRLYFTQPYVSKVLRQTEQKYQIKLVNRQQTPISLTSAGRRVQSDLERIRDDELQLKRNVQLMRRKQQLTMSIALSTILETSSLPRIAYQLHQLFPQLSFRLLNQLPDSTESELLSRSIDILVGPAIDSPLFNCQPVSEEELSLLLPAGILSPAASRTAGKVFAACQKVPAIALSRESPIQQKINGYLASQGLKTVPLCEVPNMRLAILTALQFNGFTVARTDLVKSVLAREGRTDYRVIPLDHDQLSFGDAVSCLKSSSPLVHEVAAKLVAILAAENCL